MTEPVQTLLPPNASAVERAVEAATARIDEVPTPLRELWNADTCPRALLPWLAWGLGLRTWSSDWPEGVQRARVKAAIPIARRQGTVRSVREVVESFGGGVALREWWQSSPPGTPHTFSVVLTLSGQGGAPATAQFVADVVEEVRRTKPARSHFTFTQGLQAASGIAVIGGARAAIYRRLQLAEAA